MDPVANVSLDTSEVRPSRKAAPPTAPRASVGARPRGLLIAGGAGLALAILAGAGFGAYTVLVPGSVSRTASVAAPAGRAKIQFGPLADMPDIRDGVPAIVRSAPANLVERRVAEPAPVPAAATPQGSERGVAAALARRAGPPVSDPSAEAANARAMASTVSSASLRPSVAPLSRDVAAPVRIVATQPVPSVPGAPPAPVVASLEPVASPVQAEAPPAATRRDPEPVGSIQAAPLPARPAAATPKPATGEAPPLPPVRRVSRAFEAPVQAQPAPRQASATQRPATATATAPATPPPATARAAPPPEERPEIFGLPLPRFVPTGRQIRDAASSVADAVTSIPDVF